MPKGIASGESLNIAFEQAAAKVKSSDPKKVCRLTGAEYGDDRYSFSWFGETISIGIPAVDFVPDEIPLFQRVLILHYLNATVPKQPSGEFKGFKEIEGAMFYYDAFKRRALTKLVNVFGADPSKLKAAGVKLGGESAGLGDASVKLSVLPFIEAIAIVHGGDDEFSPESNLVFSDTVGTFLPVEDIAILGDIIASKLKRAVQEE